MPCIVRVACTNQKRFVFQCDKTDVKLQDFIKAVLREYETHLKRFGQKDAPNPEVICLVDTYGCAIQDQMMGPLLAEDKCIFGLVLREDVDKLAAQYETTPSEMQDMLCFDGLKMTFYVSMPLPLKRGSKRSSPELSDAPTETRKEKKKREGGPVKEKLESIFSKKLCAHKDIEKLKTRLFDLPPDNGIKALQKFEELLTKNKSGDKAQLFIQSLDACAPPTSPSRGAASTGKALAAPSVAEETSTGKKRKKEDQDGKAEAVAAAATAAAKSSSKKAKSEDDQTADKLQLAAAGKTLFTPTTPSAEKEAKKQDQKSAEVMRTPARLLFKFTTLHA